MKKLLKLIGTTLIGSLLFAPAVHAATPYDGLNVLIKEDFQSQFSEVEGVLAVGGSATLFNYGVDTVSTPYGGAGGYGLVVGGNLNFTAGSVGIPVLSPAQTYVGGTLGGAFVNYTGGLNAANPINFSTLFSQASATSAALASYSNTGAATIDPDGYVGWLALNGDGSSAVQVFSISGADLQTRHQIVVNNVPTFSSILINVTGAFAQLASVDGTTPFAPFGGNVLFNFKDATQVNFASTGLRASVLAPNALITSTDGHIQGVVIAKSWNGDFETHPATAPMLLAVPEPETYAMMLAGLALMGFVGHRRKRAEVP